MSSIEVSHQPPEALSDYSWNTDKNVFAVDGSPFSNEIYTARILIVDDEPVNSDVMVKYLKNAGYSDFVTTTDPQQAISLVNSTKPDVVLLDLMMPHLNGLDILRSVRSIEATRFLPVIVVTAYCDSSNRMEALERGATDFLAKPVDPCELIPRLRNVLAAKIYQDQLAQYAKQLEYEVSKRTH